MLGSEHSLQSWAELCMVTLMVSKSRKSEVDQVNLRSGNFTPGNKKKA